MIFRPGFVRIYFVALKFTRWRILGFCIFMVAYIYRRVHELCPVICVTVRMRGNWDNCASLKIKRRERETVSWILIFLHLLLLT